jgi:hypothetical protein
VTNLVVRSVKSTMVALYCKKESTICVLSHEFIMISLFLNFEGGSNLGVKGGRLDKFEVL